MSRSNGKPKMVRAGDIFEVEDLKAAREIIEQAEKSSSNQHLHAHDLIRDEVIKPIMGRIDKATGQKNDPDYWAYVLQWMVTQGAGK